MDEKEFLEKRDILKNIFDNMVFEACHKFQEEFAEERGILTFLEEVMNEVLLDICNSGGVTL